MLVLMRRAAAAAAVVVGSCLSIAAHASPDTDAQAAYDQGYRAAMAQVARDQAQAAARAKQSSASVAQPRNTTFVDLKETYSDAGDSEQVERIPVVNGVARQPVITRSAQPSTAVVGLVPNPQSQVRDDDDSSDQDDADRQAAQEAIRQIKAWAAKLPHNQAQTRADDDDSVEAPAALPVAQTQAGGAATQATSTSYVPVRRYIAPPPPAISQTEPPPAGSIRRPVWSREYQRWVYLAP